MKSKAFVEKMKIDDFLAKIEKQKQSPGDDGSAAVPDETKEKIQKDCPICIQFMVEPITLNECMHRFCITCLNNNFSRSAKKSCPMCRIEYPGLLNKLFKAEHIDTHYSKFLKEVFPQEHAIRYKELFSSGSLLQEQTELTFEFGNAKIKVNSNGKTVKKSVGVLRLKDGKM